MFYLLRLIIIRTFTTLYKLYEDAEHGENILMPTFFMKIMTSRNDSIDNLSNKSSWLSIFVVAQFVSFPSLCVVVHPCSCSILYFPHLLSIFVQSDFLLLNLYC